jgi:dienelactone hydrolase
LAAVTAVSCHAGAGHAGPAATAPVAVTGEVVSFPSGGRTLHGVVHRPAGAGPFPAVLYNHGSAGGMTPAEAANALGPVFAARGWLFFMPFRRGQALSADAGPYIGDEIDAARARGGPAAAEATMVRLLSTDHLDDQLAALAWLRASGLVQPKRIAVAGNSFGGIEVVLGAERADYCAAIDSAGAAATWARSPHLRAVMTGAVRNARAPIFFFQAANDYNLEPSRVLAAAMKAAGKPFQLKIYPPYGASAGQGHTLGYFGAAIWAPDVFAFLEASCR